MEEGLTAAVFRVLHVTPTRITLSGNRYLHVRATGIATYIRIGAWEFSEFSATYQIVGVLSSDFQQYHKAHPPSPPQS